MSELLDLCAGCFQEPRPASGPCPACGFDESVEEFHSVLAPFTVLGDRYVTGRVLGKPGGFGVTHLAFDQRLHRRLALKELMPRNLVARRQDGTTLHPHTKDDEALFRNTREAFLNEARTLAKFSHPNLVRVLDYFEANGTAYFAMEYYEGQAVSGFADGIYTERGRPLTEGEAMSIMLPLLKGLRQVHSAGILHRDIKPSNIYLSRGEQRPVLLDFGSARQVLGEATRTLTSVLTPGYAPFEQYHGRGDQGPWTDVYGCAATLYFLLTRKSPPEAGSRIDGAALVPPAELVPGLDPAFSDAIVQGLAMRTQDRPRTMTAFAELLQGKTTVGSVAPTVRGGAAGTRLAPDGDETRMATNPDGTRVAPPLDGGGDDPTRMAPPGADDRTRVAPAAAGGGATVVAPPMEAASGGGGSGGRRIPRWAVPAGVGVLVVVGLATAFAVRGGGEPSSGGDPVPLTGAELVEAQVECPVVPAENQGSRASRTAGGDPAGDAAPASRQTPSGSSDGGGGDPADRRPARAAAAGSGGATLTTAGDAPAPAEDAHPLTAGVVVVFGEAPSAGRTETTILRSMLRSGGLIPMDATRLQVVRSAEPTLRAALAGDVGALARLGRENGAAVMVVGDLSVEVVPAGARMQGFYTGRAELDIRMYDTASGALLGADLFRVGGGGEPGKLGASESDARQQAVEAAAVEAAAAVEEWVKGASAP